MNIIEYDEVRLIKQNEKSTVLLVREPDEEKLFVKKILNGRHSIYSVLQGLAHPYLPQIFEVNISEDTTTVIEEYVQGQSIEKAGLSERGLCAAALELCTVLQFLHENGIIHRDIKPSNLLLAADGHIRLIDFDAARSPKDDLERDTSLLGTRGYAPPEQYGFAQTDARADVFSFGVTLEQLLGSAADKPRYRRIINKCTNLNPERRYRSARQVKRAFFSTRRAVLYSLAAVFMAALIWYNLQPIPVTENTAAVNAEVSAPALSAPEHPRWDGETGNAMWGNVPDSGTGGEVSYLVNLYRQDTPAPPDTTKAVLVVETGMRGNGGRTSDFPIYEMSLGAELDKNGFYFYEVCARGDNINFSNSSYALSEIFEYKGELAPTLPRPIGLAWAESQSDKGTQYFGTLANLEQYADLDSFNMRVFDRSNAMVLNNIMTKEFMESIGGGVWLSRERLPGDGEYRFTLEVLSSRPNEYKSAIMPEPVPEDYYSPWLYIEDYKE